MEGRSEYQPGTLTPGIDDETKSITGLVADLNRNGLFTKESQPGVPAGGHAQRAYVTGFCSAESASVLLDLSTRTGLVTVAHARGEASQASIPVTLRDGAVVETRGQDNFHPDREGPIGAGPGLDPDRPRS